MKNLAPQDLGFRMTEYKFKCKKCGMEVKTGFLRLYEMRLCHQDFMYFVFKVTDEKEASQS